MLMLLTNLNMAASNLLQIINYNTWNGKKTVYQMEAVTTPHLHPSSKQRSNATKSKY